MREWLQFRRSPCCEFLIVLTSWQGYTFSPTFLKIHNINGMRNELHLSSGVALEHSLFIHGFGMMWNFSSSSKYQ